MKSLNNKEQLKIVVSYVPHGIDQTIFKSVDVPEDFKKKVFGKKEFKFVLFWMNRNIKRKQPSDVIWAYSKFVDTLPEKDRSSVCLIMHTNPVDQNGTDLPAVKQAICPNYEVIFSTERVNQETLNYLYNLSDVTINIAGNEGFGLTTAESIMTGTPTIQTVTGGLQDQCGFTREVVVADGVTPQYRFEKFTADDYKEIGSLHEFRKWEGKVQHGEWVQPIWPRVQTMVGSVATPYIIDDKVDIHDVVEAIKYWYNKTPTERKVAGNQGREWMLKEGGLSTTNMCHQMQMSIDTTLKNFKKQQRYNLYKTNN